MNFRIFINTSLFLISMCFSLASNAEAVWIDVRTVAEHSIDKIEGDIRIPHGDIIQGLSEKFPNKNTEIHLYCRSGRRAGKAMSALEQAGYKNISNAGGIDDARKERGLNK